MLARRLRLPQFAFWKYHHPLDTVAHHSTSRRRENSSSSANDPAQTSPALSLYDKLFSSKPTARPTSPRHGRPSSGLESSVESTSQETPRSLQHSLDPEDSHAAKDAGKSTDASEMNGYIDDLRARLRSFSGLIHRRLQIKEDDGEETVVILSSTSRSLLESDLYRLAQRGKHVAGWTNGISKVIQSVSPVTREPRGQYFVFFDNPAAARVYHSRLMRIMRQTEHHDENLKDESHTALYPLEVGNVPEIMSATKLASIVADVEAADIGKPQRYGPFSASARVPHGLATHLSPDAATTAGLGSPVLVHLIGSRITAEAMMEAVRADGEDRGLPWRLLDEPPTPQSPHWPRPLRWLRAGSAEIKESEFDKEAVDATTQQNIDDSNEEDALSIDEKKKTKGRRETRQYGYTRFVITFADSVEARRFARTWHKREMVDERTGRTMVVNTAVLM
ncbi:hypothetical protein N657DRAFT_643027 [Parathielavia appendiculata]|uniref:Uncharacterized protein n=1 Tax=Parathielavia appendiculata TaxID=2587402 RepID=A0AAN6U4H6_9PEZI|nr:hypothetical protein N657DRAFT_643027 [Parathielavia appendiculata]